MSENPLKFNIRPDATLGEISAARKSAHRTIEMISAVALALRVREDELRGAAREGKKKK